MALKYADKWEGWKSGSVDAEYVSIWDMETNIDTLVRRQKQITYGKRTKGYENYLKAIPKEQRTTHHPRTPEKYQKCSRRCYDGQIKVWRLLLHAFDDVKGSGSNNNDEGRANANSSEENNNKNATDQSSGIV